MNEENLLENMYKLLDEWDKNIVNTLYEMLCKTEADRPLIELLKEHHARIRELRDEVRAALLSKHR